MSKKPCSYPGCRNLVERGRCARHRSPKTKKAADRFYKLASWLRVRQFVLERDGFRCVLCSKEVSGKGAAIVDHIKPRVTHPHLELDPTNLRTLCRDCDNRRHREKSGFRPAPVRVRYNDEVPDSF